jgi:16S rRNA (guanine966-N2)-methyltransferase
MRLVAGRFKGRVLVAPSGRATRPTADRVREALFNILAHGGPDHDGLDFENLRVLDVFAGSGALGFEAMSRGAPQAWFIEQDAEACAIIAHNARKLLIADQIKIIRCDAMKPPKSKAPFDLILFDAPYLSGSAAPALKALSATGWIARDATVIIEVGASEPFKSPLPELEIFDERRYGAARIVLGRMAGKNKT